jgi:hypothetical protein
MARFEQDPGMIEDVESIRTGAMTNYHRVGATPLVVVLRHPYPWPLRLLITWWGLLTSLAFLALVLLLVALHRASGSGKAHVTHP